MVRVPTVLIEDRELTVPEAEAIGDALWLPTAAAASVTGWTPRPEGLCKGSLCVPLPPGRERELVDGERVNVAALWRYLGKASAHSADGSVWVLGESAEDRSAALRSLDAPDFTLPDPTGRLHTLSDYRGRKVLLVTWASW
jgi:hypothetical protein